MTKKIIPILILLIISVSCLGLVSADNQTNDTAITEKNEDFANYITVSSINGAKIEFSDGFTGFCLDSSKKIDSSDKFTSQSTSNSENAFKLAIIECYKENRENDIGSVISKVAAKDTGDSIVKKVLSSSESIGDHAVVNISNSTEATFDFELLKSSDAEKSDCIAYKVSFKEIINEDNLAAGENDTDNSSDTSVIPKNFDEKNSTAESQNDAVKETKAANKTNDTSSQSGDETDVNQTNKTIINKTNTVIVNENNTTVINQKNIKTINKTKETPQNATIQDQIMKATGNPIFILAIVIVIIAIVAVVMRRR